METRRASGSAGFPTGTARRSHGRRPETVGGPPTATSSSSSSERSWDPLLQRSILEVQARQWHEDRLVLEEEHDIVLSAYFAQRS
jgi:hypothetical protein